ncbi:MAG TPA: hypothetical protein VFA51_01005 [Candidatus Udaeobacter sp.]|nr:hypothetical protein [Candidatus Udaeobacter sp.]
MMPTLWLALPFYLAVGVILWRMFPALRDAYGEAGYYGGTVTTIPRNSSKVGAFRFLMRCQTVLITSSIVCLFEISRQTFFVYLRKSAQSSDLAAVSTRVC